MEKEKSIITDAEYQTICEVFNKLGVNLTEKAGVVSDLYNYLFVQLFEYTPEIAAILGAYAVKHPDKKNTIGSFINQLSRVCKVLGYVTDNVNTYVDIDKFLCEMEKKTLDNLIYKA